MTNNNKIESRNLLKGTLIIKLGLANKFAFTRDNRPVYRTFVCTLLPADDSSWYDKFFIEMKKNAVQLCYLGRGTPATVSELRQDDYYISFFYFDADGDMNVLDTAKEFSRVLIFAAKNGLSSVKFKADVVTKPDRILGKKNAINSSNQICATMLRKMKSVQHVSASSDGTLADLEYNNMLPRYINSHSKSFEEGEVIKSKHQQQQQSSPSNKNSSSKVRLHDKNVQTTETLNTDGVSSNNIQRTPSNDTTKAQESVSFYATNCKVTVVSEAISSAVQRAVTPTKPSKEDSDVASPPRLLSVLPLYGKRKKKQSTTNSSTFSGETERIANNGSARGSNSRTLPNLETVESSNSKDDSHANIRRSSALQQIDSLDRSLSTLDEQDRLDIWQLQREEEDNFSTKVFWNELVLPDSQVSI